jgi:hypothetical protein
MAQRDQHGTLRDKFNRVIKCERDFRTATLRHDDGSVGLYRAGKLIGGEQRSTFKAVVAASVPTEKEQTARVRKPLDVNARALKL